MTEPRTTSKSHDVAGAVFFAYSLRALAAARAPLERRELQDRAVRARRGHDLAVREQRLLRDRVQLVERLRGRAVQRALAPVVAEVFAAPRDVAHRAREVLVVDGLDLLAGDLELPQVLEKHGLGVEEAVRLGVGLDLWPRDDVVLLGRGEGLLRLFAVEHADLVLDVDLRQGLLRRRGGGAHLAVTGCLTLRSSGHASPWTAHDADVWCGV